MWRSFEDACAVAEQHGLDIGYVLHANDPFACIDLDVCNAETQKQKGQPNDPLKWSTPEQIARFEKIVASSDSYTERSRSGLGLHIWVEGKIGKGKRRDGVELYSQERYIVCTGDVYVEKLPQPRYQLLQLLKAEMNRGQQLEVELEDVDDPDTADWYLAGKALDEDGNLRNDAFGKLFSGAWDGDFPSQSEADLELLKRLARHTESNAVVCSAFRMSGLGKREKAATRPNYVKHTLAVARTHLANDALAVARGKEIADALFWRVGATVVPTLKLGGSYLEVIRLCSAAEMASRAPLRWRIHGLLPEQGLVAVYGAPGSGKSFWILDMLAAIAAGNQWCGRRIRQAPVIYAALEGRAGVTLRVRGYQQQIGSMDGVTFLESAVDIRKLEDREQLIRVIREAGIAGGVLCLDTLAASGPGMDENASAEMGAMIRHLQDLQSALGGCVIVVHHTGKDESRGLRGWSGLKGALDTSIELSRTDKGVRKWRLDKSKDGADGIEGAFSLPTVVVGHDEYGDELSSCVVKPPVTFDPAFGQGEPNHAPRDAEDDEFVFAWVKAEVAKGEYPTGRSLEGQRELQMGPTRHMIQKRLRDAISRLKAASRLIEENDKESRAPSGNSWLRPTD